MFLNDVTLCSHFHPWGPREFPMICSLTCVSIFWGICQSSTIREAIPRKIQASIWALEKGQQWYSCRRITFTIGMTSFLRICLLLQGYRGRPRGTGGPEAWSYWKEVERLLFNGFSLCIVQNLGLYPFVAHPWSNCMLMLVGWSVRCFSQEKCCLNSHCFDMFYLMKASRMI